MDNNNNIIRLDSIPTTKEGIGIMASDMVSAMTEGEVDPLSTIVKARALAEAVKAFLDDKEVKDIVTKEIEKNGKSATWNGATLTLKEVGVKYDYSGTNDPVLASLYERRDKIAQEIKDREAFLKAIKPKFPYVDIDTGELYELNPPVKTSTSSYVVSFAKK